MVRVPHHDPEHPELVDGSKGQGRTSSESPSIFLGVVSLSNHSRTLCSTLNALSEVVRDLQHFPDNHLDLFLHLELIRYV